MSISFQKAQKYEAKGRVALIGPAGSGKSYTMLQLARLLAGPNGKIAAVDSEHGSLSKYADLFEFDVVELDSFSPTNFLEALHVAEKGGYSVFCCDSLSHFWMGKDGALEFVDQAKKRSQSRDDMSGWKEFRPHEREMVDAMIASPLHVICTMRTKTAYEEQVNERTGKKQRVKIGLAPVQREGLEFEFDFVGSMDDENNLIVDKTRCSFYSGKVLSKPSPKDFEPFRDWLSGAAAPVKAAPIVPVPVTQHQQRPFNVRGNHVTCFALNVEARVTNNDRSFRVLKMNGKIDGKELVFCWHGSLFDALSRAKDQVVQFEFEKSNDGKYLNVVNVLAVGDQEYRDGKPWVENQDAEPPKRDAASLNPEITDADLPEEMFA